MAIKRRQADQTEQAVGGVLSDSTKQLKAIAKDLMAALKKSSTLDGATMGPVFARTESAIADVPGQLKAILASSGMSKRGLGKRDMAEDALTAFFQASADLTAEVQGADSMTTAGKKLAVKEAESFNKVLIASLDEVNEATGPLSPETLANLNKALDEAPVALAPASDAVTALAAKIQAAMQ